MLVAIDHGECVAELEINVLLSGPRTIANSIRSGKPEKF